MARDNSANTHSTNMNALTQANEYLAQYSANSDNLVVVFGDENFREEGPNGTSATGKDIIGAFDSKDLDFMFLKPNNKYDFYRSAGTKEDDSSTYTAVNTSGSNALTNLIETASGNYSSGSIRYLGFGLSGSFAALWYSLNVFHTHTPDRCVVVGQSNKLPTISGNIAGASANINAINNLPGYNSALYNIATNDDIVDNSDCHYYLAGTTTTYPDSTYSSETGESNVTTGAYQDFDDWGTNKSHITVRGDMIANWYSDTFGGISDRSS